MMFLFAGTYWLSCTGNSGQGGDNPHIFVAATPENLKQGKALVAQYCQSCHMLPVPSLLTKEMWYIGVLPRMGPFLGIIAYNGMPYARANDVDIAAYFPSKPVIDSVKWKYIVDYFTTMAPDVMPPQNKDTTKVIKALPMFDLVLPKAKAFYGQVSMTSYVKIDTTVRPHRLFVNDGMAKNFILLDDQLQVQQVFRTSGPIVDLDFQKDGILACSIGKNLEANNLANGDITRIRIDDKGQVTADKTPMFNKLARPVKITEADLNGDGKTDYLISQFGNLVGDLSWMENKGSGQYAKHVLRQRSGALNTIVADANHDGLPDVWAQFAQGEEGIFLYTNKGKGQFEERQVLRFPPAYGSTSFSLVDFNHDGYPDILYTCGDNGDYTPILKPYHGVYIFLNDGKNNFTQKYFYPINGCYKAIAADFDGDGDLDIATISFYPSDHQSEAFIYLENKGNYNFQPYALPVGTPFQKGITMDAGDLDGDGKPDLVLGNGYYSSDSTSTYKEPLFIYLKNKSAGLKKNRVAK